MSLKSTDELNFLSSDCEIVQPTEMFQYVICCVFTVEMSVRFYAQHFAKAKLTWAQMKFEPPFFSPWLTVALLEHRMME